MRGLITTSTVSQITTPTPIEFGCQHVLCLKKWDGFSCPAAPPPIALISKKICGNFDFMPSLKSYDNFKTSKNKHKIYIKLLASGVESL